LLIEPLFGTTCDALGAAAALCHISTAFLRRPPYAAALCPKFASPPPAALSHRCCGCARACSSPLYSSTRRHPASSHALSSPHSGIVHTRPAFTASSSPCNPPPLSNPPPQRHRLLIIGARFPRCLSTPLLSILSRAFPPPSPLPTPRRSMQKAPRAPPKPPNLRAAAAAAHLKAQNY
jgi:hypothetical protein